MQDGNDLIEQRLGAWLTALADSGLTSLECLELEDHVRTQLESLGERAIAVEELEQVLADIGDPSTIGREYRKNTMGRARRLLRVIIAHDRRFSRQLNEARPKRRFAVLANALAWAAAMLTGAWLLGDTSFATAIVPVMTGGWYVSHVLASTPRPLSALRREWACATHLLRSRG